MRVAPNHLRFSPLFPALLLAVGLGACGKKESEKAPAKTESAPQPAPTQAAPAAGAKAEAPAESAEAKRPEGPVGTIAGTVFIDGDVPAMPKLQMGSDPVCAQSEQYAETIISEKGGLGNVVVRIKPGTVPGWVPSEPIVVDQSGCMYQPRVQPGVIGQTVRITNGDKTTHNVHARHLPLGERQGTETLLNKAQPTGVDIEFELGDEPVTKLKCDFHGWMQGFVVASDNPYAAVTTGTGRFQIEGVPVGEHKIEVWHEYYGIKEATLVVEESKTATLEMRYDAAQDKPN